MTRTEICRAIAEKLEPNPTKEGSSHLESEGRWWRWIQPNFRVNGVEFLPLNFFTDEAASARLRRTAKIHLWFTSAKEHSVDEFKGLDLWHAAPHHSQIIESDPDDRIAIVLAVAKWLGIEVGELED